MIYEAVFSHNIIHLSTIDAEDTHRTERVCHTWFVYFARTYTSFLSCDGHTR
jgi:hypothetical protein